MRDRPAGVAERDVARALADGWGLATPALRLRYAPVGGGSYHWVVTAGPAGRWFVTVDDLDDKNWLGRTRPAVFSGLRAAMDAALWLRREEGLGFVAAPVPALDGQAVRPPRRTSSSPTASPTPATPSGHPPAAGSCWSSGIPSSSPRPSVTCG